MINRITTLCLKLLLKFLDRNSDFFEGTKSDKKSFLKGSKLPTFLQLYLLEVKHDKFMSDLEGATDFLNGKQLSSSNSLLKTISLFLSYSLMSKLDQLPSNFSLLSANERTNQLDALLSSRTTLGGLLTEILTTTNLDSFNDSLSKFTSKFAKHRSVIVQSSTVLGLDLKSSIREFFHDQDKFALPIFQVQPALLGGLRIIVDGECFDSSYMQLINNLNI